MDWVETAILVLHVLIAVSLVVIVLLQRGKGADMGAAFGGGSSQTVFGSAGGGNFLQKLTGVMAFVFFATSFSLAVYAQNRAEVAPETGIPTVEETIPAEMEERRSGTEDDLPPME